MYKLNCEHLENTSEDYRDVHNLLHDLKNNLFEINSYSFSNKDKIKFYALLVDIYFDTEDNFGPFGIFVCPENIRHLIKIFSIDIANRVYNGLSINCYAGMHIFRLIKCSAILNTTEKNNLQDKYKLSENCFEKI